ncbi:MAG: AraC family transcriptional regulator [Lachnospiraceae bacterium]|nr:AraC family transcriptional regulator [Lachnospiraceae bacterium]
MLNAINWKDEYFVSKDRICLTGRELQIPGLRLFATHNIQNAIFPLSPHYHENAFEFSYISKGSMSFYVNGKEFTVSGGDVFVSFPNEVHSTNDVPISLNQQYWIQVDVSDPKHFLFLAEDTAASLIKGLYSIDSYIVHTASSPIRMGQMIENAFNLCMQGQNQLLAACHLSIFLQALVDVSQSNTHGTVPPDIQAALAYIDEHIGEELELDEIAQVCHLSTSQFKQKFRRVIGSAPRDYINRKKIERAKKLLLDGRSITDVAMDLSFASSSYFSSVFKKYTLQSPREYLKRASLGEKL